MPAVVILDVKNINNTSKNQLLFRDSDNLLTSRGFRIFSEYPRIYYNNEQINSTSLESVIKMIKQHEFYNQVVKDIIFTTQFKR